MKVYVIMYHKGGFPDAICASRESAEHMLNTLPLERRYLYSIYEYTVRDFLVPTTRRS